MNDKEITIKQLKEIFQKFCLERGWDKFTDPKDLSMDITTESSELMKLFVYEQDLKKVVLDKRQEIENEVADITFALLNFCSVLDIDVSKAVEDKLKLTAKKYPPQV